MRKLPTLVVLLIAVLAAIEAYRSISAIMLLYDHGHPGLAAANYFTALVCSSAALGIPYWLFKSIDRPESPVRKFFDDGSGFWPTVLGLVILGAGLYGLLVVANYEDYDWVFYSVEAGLGAFILKRTYTVDD